MRKLLKTTFFVLIILILAIQAVRPRRSNPPIEPAREITALHPANQNISAMLERSCNDCHSNRTVWPWYSNVAPASWLVARDVNNGRDALNLSEWGTYNKEKRQELAGKICEEAKDREMPLLQYNLVHPQARLSSADAATMCSWTQQIAPGGAQEKEEGD